MTETTEGNGRLGKEMAEIGEGNGRDWGRNR